MIFHYFNNESLIFYYAKNISSKMDIVSNDHYWQINFALKSIFLFFHDLLYFTANLHLDHITQKHLN